MPATYEPIATTTLGSNSATVTFSSIPGTYTDLIIIAHAKNTTASGYGFQWRFNSDSANNYATTFLSGNGSSASSFRNSGVSVGGSGYTSASNPSPVIVQIMSYANTNVFKTSLTASAASDHSVVRTVSLWRSTSAVTAIELRSESGSDFASGSTFSLYGIKAA